MQNLFYLNYYKVFLKIICLEKKILIFAFLLFSVVLRGNWVTNKKHEGKFSDKTCNRCSLDVLEMFGDRLEMFWR